VKWKSDGCARGVEKRNISGNNVSAIEILAESLAVMACGIRKRLKAAMKG